jgi:hypothetical protein
MSGLNHPRFKKKKEKNGVGAKHSWVWFIIIVLLLSGMLRPMIHNLQSTSGLGQKNNTNEHIAMCPYFV